MILISLTGLLTLTVAVNGNYFGPSFPPMPNFPSFPSFTSPFSADDPFASQPSFSGFNSFPYGQSNDFGAFSGDSTSGNVIQTIKLEKNGPDGSTITETIETLGGPNGGSSVNRKTSSSSSSKRENPVKVVHFYGGNKPSTSASSNRGIAVGEPNPSTPTGQDTSSDAQSSNRFPSFDDFSSFSSFNGGFFPSSTGISSAASSSSSSNFVSSSSTKTNPDGSTVTETVTYDSKNPKKVKRVIKRVDANGKVTITNL